MKVAQFVTDKIFKDDFPMKFILFSLEYITLGIIHTEQDTNKILNANNLLLKEKSDYINITLKISFKDLSLYKKTY